MLISTKGTNAIRALVDIAKHQDECEYIPLSAIATRLNISRKYLECIMCLLAKNKMVCVCKGKFGGYRLCKNPEEYSLFDILIITEEEFKTYLEHIKSVTVNGKEYVASGKRAVKLITEDGKLDLTNDKVVEVLQYIKDMQEAGAIATVAGGQPDNDRQKQEHQAVGDPALRQKQGNDVHHQHGQLGSGIQPMNHGLTGEILTQGNILKHGSSLPSSGQSPPPPAPWYRRS